MAQFYKRLYLCVIALPLLFGCDSLKEQINPVEGEVEILRDKWGIPHIFGKTDEDVAFALAYAHAEDDWPTLQVTIAAARGRLSEWLPGPLAFLNDFMVQALLLSQDVESAYLKLQPKTRSILEAYARGLNHYAKVHPKDRLNPKANTLPLLPITSKDLAAAMVHRLALFMGVHRHFIHLLGLSKALKELDDAADPDPKPSPRQFFPPRRMLIGSNGHAVSGHQSSDGITRLNVNSHQPWTGPVAWYEVHVQSQEGWHFTGSTFAAAPFPFVGHNDHLGWGHTVNRPDFTDLFQLKTRHVEGPSKAIEFLWDTHWKPLKKAGQFRYEKLLEQFNTQFKQKLSASFYKSPHGPVIQTDKGFFAFRYAGKGRHLLAADQWYQMNKAKSWDEWHKAMQMQAIPMFNTVYADTKHNIYYVYNAALANRKKGLPWTGIVDGSKSENLWKTYLPFQDLPQVLNPKSGYVQNCNSSPFRTTIGEGNPEATKYDVSYGIETRMSNRALRTHELFGALLKEGKKISREDFWQCKFDRAYSKNSHLYQALKTLADTHIPENAQETAALKVLKTWLENPVADSDHKGAALGVLALGPIATAIELEASPTPPKALDTFRKAIQFIEAHFASNFEIPLGDIQRIQRGEVNEAIQGGPDTLNAVYTKPREGNTVAFTGDSNLFLVEFGPSGVESWATHQFGSSNRPTSPHFSDQVRHFVQGKNGLRKTLRRRDEIRKPENLERAYTIRVR